MFKRYFPITLLFVLFFFTSCSTTVPTPSNQALVINSIPPTSALVGDTYTYQVEASDAEGDSLTYSLTAHPSGMTIDSVTGLISWTPTMTGNYNISLKVSDGELSDTQSYILAVSSIPAITLSPPGNVDAITPEPLKVLITWDEVNGATHYQVYRATSLNRFRTPISGWQTETSYLDTDVIKWETYYYWVKAATSETGENASAYSEYDTATVYIP